MQDFWMNELRQLNTIQHQTPNGPFYTIMMALDIHDPSTAPDFITQVLEKFKMQWMIGPPGTTHLIVTLDGRLSAAQFAQYWQDIVAVNPVLATIMSMMNVADVLRAPAHSESLEKATLLRTA
jgi:hypothetical protein